MMILTRRHLRGTTSFLRLEAAHGDVVYFDWGTRVPFLLGFLYLFHSATVSQKCNRFFIHYHSWGYSYILILGLSFLYSPERVCSSDKGLTLTAFTSSETILTQKERK